jgi:hypothetical protein
MIVMLAAALVCVTAWVIPGLNATPLSSYGEGAAPTRVVRVPGDIPAGYQPPPPPAPTQGEPPQLIEVTDGGAPEEPKPLWGPDATVYGDNIKYINPLKSERMIAYDQTENGILFAAFVVPNGDTAHIYRSTDGGNNWALWNGMRHPGNVWSSLELVVAEGDSSFLFFFAKSSAGNGDIYVGRWNLAGTTADLFSVKVDADTVANFSACRDIENPYRLYVVYETRNGEYNIYGKQSEDYGKTWTNNDVTITDTQTPPKPDICYGNGGHVYVVCRDWRQSSVDSVSFRLKHSTNRGETWLGSTQIGTPITPVYDPVVGARHTGGTVWLVHMRNMEAHNGSGLGVFTYTSTNNGDTWRYGGDGGIGHGDTDSDEQMPSIACSWGPGLPTVSYTVTPGESIMFTWCPGDTNWTTPERVNDHQGTGFFPSQAGWKTVGGNWSTVLYAGYTAHGLYFDAFSMTGTDEGRPVAEKPVALTARPSPALDRAVISYSLPGTGPARVSVSDIAGREVAVLEHGTFAAGVRSVVWNCKKAPAGVYLIRVDTGTGSQAGRFVVFH